MSILAVTDLPAALRNHELVVELVAGANAKAARVAPCLVSTDPAPTSLMLDEARLTLIGAVKRWTELEAGAVQQQAAGPFSMSIDTRQRTGYNLWPSEIKDLQAICSAGQSKREAWSVDTAPVGASHLPWCDLMFGAVSCSCGADIAGYPIFEA